MTDKKLTIKKRAAMHVQQKRKARLVSYIQLSSTPAKIGAIRIGLDELDVSGSMADKVLYLLDYYKGRKENEINDARLIAAAPDLLEALDELANGYAGNGWDVGLVTRLEKARAVIAKARGESNEY